MTEEIREKKSFLQGSESMPQNHVALWKSDQPLLSYSNKAS